MKAPRPPNEPARLKALHRYDILDTAPEQEFDDITLLASHICGTPIALISLLDKSRQWFKSKVGTTESETARDIAFCAYGILQADVFVVNDAQTDKRFAANPLVAGNSRIRFYAGAPLITSDGHALGMLCVMDQVPRELSAEQKAALQAFSRQVVAQLELRRSMTELRQAERALRRMHDEMEARVQQRTAELVVTSRRLASIVESSNDAIIGETLEGIVTSWNRAAETIFGYTATEMIGHSVAVLLPPGHATEERVIVDRIVGSEETYQLETHRMRKDGVEIDVAATVSPIRDWDGKIVGVSRIGRDITERKRAEEALRESERGQRAIATQLEAERARLVAAQAVAKVGSWETDLRTLVVTWSAETYRIFEAPADSFPGTHAEFLAFVHPEDRASVGAAFSNSVGQAGPFSVQHRLLLPDGRIKHVEEHWQFSYDERGEAALAVGTCQDITERKRSEQVIERGLQRLTEAQRIGQIGDWEWDIATQAITWSPQVFELLGRDPHLGPPRNYEENAALFDAASQAVQAEKIARAIESGEAQDYELRAHRPNGTPVDVLGRAVPRKDESGKVVGLVGTVQDVTQRKRSEDALRVSESRYRSLFENMMEGYAYCRTLFEQDQLRDFTYVEVNSAFERLTGLKDVVGKKVSEVIPGVYEASPELFEVYGRVALTGKPEKYETHLKSLGIWFSVTVYSSAREHFVAVFDNITERKQAETALRASEARLNFALEANHAGAWDLNLVDHTAHRTLLHDRIFGYEKLRENWTFEVFIEHVLPEDREEVNRSFRAASAAQSDWSFECRIRRLDGEVRWISSTGGHERNAEGKPGSMSGLVQDITERKRAEAELEKTHGKLVKASRQAGMAEVATGVLHNVGNVLNSVNVSATLVADQVRHSKVGNIAKVAALFDAHKADLGEFLTKDERGQMIPGYLGTLAESLATEQKSLLTELDHLRKNVEHIKDIVSMQQSHGRSAGVIEEVVCAELVEEALRINASSLLRHDVELVRDFQVRPVLSTDRHKVMQILINLLRNALHACDESGRPDKRITVRLTGGPGWVRIAVCDNGTGIRPENLARIFSHGFTTKQSGHGYGLHSGALAAKEIGGSLSVQSDGPGLGATFILELPVRPPTAGPFPP